MLVGFQAVVNAFCIVQTVNIENNFLAVIGWFKGSTKCSYFFISIGFVEFAVVYADGKHINLNQSVVVMNNVPFVVKPQHHLYALQEMRSIINGLKTD